VFFDVDETLINIKSMFDFLEFYYLQQDLMHGKQRFQYTMMKFKKMAQEHSREVVNQAYYQLFNGEKRSDMLSLGEKWFITKLDIFKIAVVEKLRWHQQHGHIVILVSGSFEVCLLPIARAMGVTEILSVRLEHINGKYTGNILPPQTIGTGKAVAVANYLKEYAAGNPRIYIYGDHISDLPMLLLATDPIVIAQCTELMAYAKQHEWPILKA
jgi:HAD superfamily hydrolase (TIGR01490 family)